MTKPHVQRDRNRDPGFQSVHDLEKAIHDYLDARTDKPFVGAATADRILESIRRFCLSRSGD